ncbi:MAG: permease-like cell division protein FtsX [Candidatus Zixiibacteriota bacterium]
MTRFSFVWRELGRMLYRYPGTALGSFLSLSLLFLLFDVFWVATGTTNQFYATLLSDLRMEAFVSEELPDSALTRLSSDIADMAGIRSVEYVSREQARQDLANLVGTDLLVGYDSLNPLPRSFVLILDGAYHGLSAMGGLEQRLVALTGVAEVHYSKKWLEQMEQTRLLFRTVGLALGAIILLAAIITTSNSIRLMTRARALGLHQMRLLGAGRLFTASPFLLEGFLLTGMSAVGSWGLLLIGVRKISFSQFAVVVPAYADMALFCLAAALLGAVSGLLGIRKALR